MNFRHFTLLLLTLVSCRNQSVYFGIKIIDQETKRGVPMVEMKTLNSIVYHSDNGGYVAFHEPDMMNQALYFQIKSPGYHYPMDEAGRSGISLKVTAGLDTVIEIRRVNIAERLYRMTGSGKTVHKDALFPENMRMSKSPKGGVLGQDSNLATPYQGKIFWAWGDTFLPGSYHGNFAVAAAWTSDPRFSAWSAEDGIDLSYLTDDQGWSKPMIHLNGPGYVWLDFLMTVPSDGGVDKLISKYARVNAYFGNYERGIAVFNDEKQIFEKYREVTPWLDQPHTTEHPVKVSLDDEMYYYLTSELNFSRVKPHLDSVSQPDRYEYFTCLLPGEFENGQKPGVARDATGRLVYRWKKNAKTLNYQLQKDLIDQGIISKDEALIQTIDLLTGEPVDAGRGSITWNPYRQRWILIAGKQDIWYGQADTPTGPWVYLTRVATHDQFYYNPVHHAFLDQADGQRIYFEGTLTKFFSPEPAIPRYDYNQLLYGVNLTDPQLILPVPVYRIASGDKERLGLLPQVNDSIEIREIPFFALDRDSGNESVLPIYQSTDHSGRLLKSDDGKTQPLFYAIKPEARIETLFEGSWEFTIASRSFDNSVTLQIEQELNTWQIQVSRSDFQFSNLRINQDTIQLDLSHEDAEYHLTGTLLPGSISGSFTNITTKSSGNWSANKFDLSDWHLLSPGLVNLYEIIGSDGVYTYSIHIADDEQSSLFCKVWINPSKQLNFDYKAKPVL